MYSKRSPLKFDVSPRSGASENHAIEITEAPEVQFYLDYRRFLDDSFAFRQARNPRYSLRAFAKLVGHSTPNFLRLIIEGHLNLNSDTLAATAKALGLSGGARDYFESLVWFNQARDHESKNRYFEKLLETERYQGIKVLGASQFRYFSQWYHPVVRELAARSDFDGTPAYICKRIFPRLAPKQAKASLALLIELGLIERNAAGGFLQKDTLVATAPEVASLALMNFHRAMLNVSQEALRHFNSSERDFRCLTLALSEDEFKAMKQRFESFWRETLQLAQNGSGQNRVYQINMQLFPLTEESGAKNEA
jgi:uncharacterized protein (TIGR02147 family)